MVVRNYGVVGTGYFGCWWQDIYEEENEGAVITVVYDQKNASCLTWKKN